MMNETTPFRRELTYCFVIVTLIAIYNFLLMGQIISLGQWLPYFAFRLLPSTLTIPLI